MKPLPRSFYSRDTVVAAKELLARELMRQTDYGNIVAKIAEVEAYRGSDDPPSHAHRGKTPRNYLLFGMAGFAYVYFIYGNHYCFNVTTEQENIPGAVLVRAVEIVEGLKIASKNRRVKNSSELSNGPGKLTKALNITKIHNGLDLTKAEELFISDTETRGSFETIETKRIGINVGREKPWRFYLAGHASVSGPRRLRI